jgi:hypothetical protein
MSAFLFRSAAKAGRVLWKLDRRQSHAREKRFRRQDAREPSDRVPGRPTLPFGPG